MVDPEWAIDWSILHDLLYETQGGSRQYRVWQIDGTYRLADLVDWRTNERISISRAEADAILRAGWELGSGMPADMADCGYAAVRTFGRDAWLSEEPSTVANTMASAEEWCTSAVA